MLLVLPIALPLAAAVVCFLLRERPRARSGVAVGAASALVVAAAALLAHVAAHGPAAAQMGGWPAPFGITLVADLLSACMVLVAAVSTLGVVVYALGEVPEIEQRRGWAGLAFAMVAGVCGAFLTGDLFNLYVWFEVQLIAAFGLLSLRRTRAAAAGAVRYVTLNLLATVAMLAGVALLYGATGHLNMAMLRGAVAGSHEFWALAPAALLLFAFGAKAALFPAFLWLPASYHTPAVATSALFSALLTKAAVYVLFRLFTLIWPLDLYPGAQGLLLAVSGVTMVVGVLGAAAQMEVRRILSFHIVSQIGYMTLGLALYSPLAIAGGLFYMVHNIAAKTNLFLMGGVAKAMTGSEHLSRMGGVWRARPFAATLFLISALAMAGAPPLTGFWAKLALVVAAYDAGDFVAAGAVLGVGLLTLYSMTKIWNEGFWKPHPDPDWTPAPAPATMAGVGAAVAGLLIVMGLAAGPLLEVADAAARQLLDPDPYVAAVLGEDGAAAVRAAMAEAAGHAAGGGAEAPVEADPQGAPGAAPDTEDAP
ncbi:MAG: proton-conducting transporter membrane subunit [Rubrimonas sp.]